MHVSKVVLISILLLGLFQTGCLKTKGVRDVSFDVNDEGQYIFEDYQLRLEFKPMGRQFNWRFLNHRRHPLNISHQEAFFNLDGYAEQFSLWGADRSRMLPVPDIKVRPGGFVAVGYPVLMSSPLVPWRVKEDEGICLFLTARWDDGKVKTYRLCMPLEGDD